MSISHEIFSNVIKAGENIIFQTFPGSASWYKWWVQAINKSQGIIIQLLRAVSWGGLGGMGGLGGDNYP